MYTIYSIPGSCSTGITVLCEQLGLTYKIIKRADVANYQEIVPTNQVPALQDDEGNIILEGAAIVQFLLSKHLQPEDGYEKSHFDQLLMFNYATLHSAYSKLFTVSAIPDLDETERLKVMSHLANQVSSLWQIVASRLENKDFMLGEKASIIDYLLAIYAGWNVNFPALKFNLTEPVIKHIERVSELPEFKRGYQKEGAVYPSDKLLNAEFAMA